MIVCGIDVGSRTVKAVLLDTKRSTILASGIADQGVHQVELLKKLLRKILRKARLKAGDVDRTVATGYGRNSVVPADSRVTEITCHARGVRHLVPRVRTVIDIGGQDSKVIRLDRRGTVHDFAMNNRCAAGTGRFLELVAERLEVGFPELGRAAARARKPATISSMCAVFAETEIVGFLASGEKPENIAAGVQEAIASRILAMSGRDLESPVVFTGGVALVPGMRDALERAFGQKILVARDPQFTGALGAALIAGD
jgi:predicted CoA-substrate-specific enzyme activase